MSKSRPRMEARGGRVFGGGDTETVLEQIARETVTDELVVIDDQDVGGSLRFAEGFIEIISLGPVPVKGLMCFVGRSAELSAILR